MSEVLFYHLERRGLDDVLPGLVEKARERGWNVLIRAESAERAQAIDTLLWTYDEQSFLPHARTGDGDAARQPVLITLEEGNPNARRPAVPRGRRARARLGQCKTGAFLRIVLLFDGRDALSLAAARAAWKDAKTAGHAVTYWKEMPPGKWEKQG